MLNKPAIQTEYSSATLFRMRERGPIESAKYNKSSVDISKDIKRLENHVQSSYNELREYISDTHFGNDTEHTICMGGKEVFTGVHSVTNDIINNVKNNRLSKPKGVKV